MARDLSAVAVEWVVPHPQVQGAAGAIIRLVSIDRQPYWRVVTGERDRSQRSLIGYWGSLEEAEHNAIAWWERKLPHLLAEGGSRFREPRQLTPQKPPPGASGHELVDEISRASSVRQLVPGRR